MINVNRSFVVGNSVGELARFDLRKGRYDVTIVTSHAATDLRVELAVTRACNNFSMQGAF